MARHLVVLSLLVLALVALAAAYPADEEIPVRDNPKNSLFDDIFNIPISVLHAVRRLLTNYNGAGAGAVGDAQIGKSHV